MGVRKNPFTGEITEEETRMYKPGASSPEGAARRVSGGSAEAATEPTGTAGREGLGSDAGRTHFEAPTRKVKPVEAPDSGERTRLISPRGAAAEAGPGTAGAGDPMADPVVGWLVVVAGPGKGSARRLGYGTNTLGRAEGSRVRLDFGDNRISRETHATLTYDPRGRKYYLQHGGGMNLTYLGDEPVLAPTVLEAMQEIAIGETRLRFVPLCGADFDWQDLEAE